MKTTVLLLLLLLVTVVIESTSTNKKTSFTREQQNQELYKEFVHDNRKRRSIQQHGEILEIGNSKKLSKNGIVDQLNVKLVNRKRCRSCCQRKLDAKNSISRKSMKKERKKCRSCCRRESEMRNSVNRKAMRHEKKKCRSCCRRKLGVLERKSLKPTRRKCRRCCIERSKLNLEVGSLKENDVLKNGVVDRKSFNGGRRSSEREKNNEDYLKEDENDENSKSQLERVTKVKKINRTNFQNPENDESPDVVPVKSFGMKRGNGMCRNSTLKHRKFDGTILRRCKNIIDGSYLDDQQLNNTSSRMKTPSQAANKEQYSQNKTTRITRITRLKKHGRTNEDGAKNGNDELSNISKQNTLRRCKNKSDGSYLDYHQHRKDVNKTENTQSTIRISKNISDGSFLDDQQGKFTKITKIKKYRNKNGYSIDNEDRDFTGITMSTIKSVDRIVNFGNDTRNIDSSEMTSLKQGQYSLENKGKKKKMKSTVTIEKFTVKTKPKALRKKTYYQFASDDYLGTNII